MADLNIIDFYKGKNIFLTGGTGFVGIALIEKLLRTVPDIGKIYILVRPKFGKDVKVRLEELQKNRVFERVCDEKGKGVFDKLVAVAGDVGEQNLGLSEVDRQMLVNDVNVVFHCAATLDFGTSLKTNVIINLAGTRSIVQLCKEMKHLNALLHVSSAYVNSNRKDPKEVIYSAPENVDKVIQIAYTMSDLAIDSISPTILGTHLNAYTFTKALAEHEVANSFSSFPSCIVRPSMIVAAWKEPVEGWTISKNGPQGFMMGISKGVVRRLPLDSNVVCDYIPIDIVVNGMLAGAWHVSTKSLSETPVFHLTSSTCNPFKWDLVKHDIDRIIHKYPLTGAAWYPYVKFIPSIFWFRVAALLFHILPAYILDAVTYISGGRPILRKLHRNINKSLDLLEPFIFTEWMFDNKQTLALHNSLSDGDKLLFNLDIRTLEWTSYFENLLKGVREYLNNEKLSTVQAGKKKQTILWFLNILIQAVFLATVWLIFSAVSGFTLLQSYWVLPLLGGVFSLL